MRVCFVTANFRHHRLVFFIALYFFCKNPLSKLQRQYSPTKVRCVVDKEYLVSSFADIWGPLLHRCEHGGVGGGQSGGDYCWKSENRCDILRDDDDVIN